MATKKKAAKPAKKSTPTVKKIAPAKKAAAKPAHSSGAGKATKKAPVAKSTVRPVGKKVATAPASPAKKTAAAVKKTTVSNVSKPASKSQPAHPPVAGAAKPVVSNTAAVSKAAPKEEVKKAVVPPPPPVQIKPEVKKPAPPPAKPAKVVIPEIKTKTVRKYEPEFTKSVLDTPQEDQTGPTMRYSDAELGEFRELINRKLDAAKKELAYLQGLITRKDEMGGDNDDARYMTMEDGSMSMEREQLSQMASRQITFIDHLEKALMRIENKTYGICRVTGKLIDKARLRAVPHATLSIEAKQMMNK
ncbi:MAG: TraR/DksA family transcriptional regulator [Chitinophagaceae bacterium]|nr:TraR/DksA family transcriptional regulator [Chitinophagaceae bacterium]